MIIKYEDLIENKELIVNNLVNFFEKNYGFKFNNIKEKINNIIITTDINYMKAIEGKEGFDEAKKHTNFFNVGKKNQWKLKLKVNQASIIEEKFKKEMMRFKYL